MSMNASLPSQVSSFVSAAANLVSSQASATSAAAGANLAAQATSAAEVAALAAPVLVGAVGTAALGGAIYAIPEFRERFQNYWSTTADKILVGTGVGMGIAVTYGVTGAAITAAVGAGVVGVGAKVLSDMRAARREEEAQIKAQRDAKSAKLQAIIKTTFDRLPPFNSVRSVVELDEAAKRPPVISDQPLKIKMNDHNGIVAASLQLLARPSFMERIPKAIQSRLAEEDLFGSFGVKKILQENPDLSFKQKMALASIGKIMRQKTINAEELKGLKESLFSFMKGEFPTNGLTKQNERKIRELAFLLGLREFFINNQTAPGQVGVSGQSFRLLDPEKFVGEMKDWDPLNVLRETTQLLEDEPMNEETHRVRYCVAGHPSNRFDKAPDLIVHQLTRKMEGRDFFEKIPVGAKTQEYRMEKEGGYLCWNGVEGANHDHATATVFRNGGKVFHCDNLAPLEQQNTEKPAKELPQLDRVYLVMAGKVEDTSLLLQAKQKLQSVFS